MESVRDYDESIVGQNWVARSLDLVERYPLERPLPPTHQTAFPADYFVFLPGWIGGEIVAAEAIIVAQQALDAAHAPRPEPPSTTTIRVYTPQSHGTPAVDLAAGDVVTIYNGDRQRSYSLIVNQGANPAFLSYGKDADGRGLPLAPNGDGFHELVNGTRSSASVFSPLGTTIVWVDGRHDPALTADDA